MLVVGVSGAGKSSLINSLCGMSRPTETGQLNFLPSSSSVFSMHMMSWEVVLAAFLHCSESLKTQLSPSIIPSTVLHASPTVTSLAFLCLAFTPMPSEFPMDFCAT